MNCLKAKVRPNGLKVLNMTIIKNNIEIAKIYRGINSIGKIYVGDKLVFGGGVTPTPASSVLVYNEASPSKLTLKDGP